MVVCGAIECGCCESVCSGGEVGYGLVDVECAVPKFHAFVGELGGCGVVCVCPAVGCVVVECGVGYIELRDVCPGLGLG